MCLLPGTGARHCTYFLPGPKPALFAQLDRRLDAERWHADLVGHAAAPKRLWPDRRRFVARLLLRGPPRWYEWGFTLADLRLLLGTPRQALTQALQHYERHEEWLGERFAAHPLVPRPDQTDTRVGDLYHGVRVHRPDHRVHSEP